MKEETMITKDLAPIREQLNRIEQKLEGRLKDRFLDISEVSAFTTLSISTLRRCVHKKTLRCSKKVGKLLFLESDVRKWLAGK